MLPTGGRGRRFAALPQLLERAPGQDQLQDGSTARQPGFQQMPAFQNGLAAAATLWIKEPPIVRDMDDVTAPPKVFSEKEK